MLLCSSRADIDFAPLPSRYEVDGLSFPNVAFRDGLKKVTYLPPQGWPYHGSHRRITLQPPDIAHAEAIIESSRPSPVVPVNDQTISAYQKLAGSLVPKDATRVVCRQSSLHERVGGYPTVEIVFDYIYFGRPEAVSFLFLQRDQEQLRFILFAPPDAFGDLRSRFHASLYSLEGL